MQASITSLLPSPETISMRLPFGPTTAIDGQLRTPMLLPHVHRVVVHDRVGDLVSQYGVADVCRHLFVVELGRVHADKRDGKTGVTLLEFGQVRQNMDAVDAAVSPKIEHGDFACELLGEGERRGVKPVFAGGELGGAELLGPLIDPLDVGLELLDARRELGAARRQVGRLA